MTTFTVLVCLLAALQVHAMDLEKPKDDDSPSEPVSQRRRPIQIHISYVTHRRKNSTETLGDYDEIESPPIKQYKSAEKSAPSLKNNSSDSRTNLPPPPLTKPVDAQKGTVVRPDKNRPSGEDTECESGDCSRVQTDVTITSAPTTTKVYPGHHQANTGGDTAGEAPKASSETPTPTRFLISPSPSPVLTRVGEIRRDPLWGKDRDSLPTPRADGDDLGNGFDEKSENRERTRPAEENGPRNGFKNDKDKPHRKEGKQVNETFSPDGHSSNPEKVDTSHIPLKTSKPPKTVDLPDEGAGGKPVVVIEPHPFPKPTKPNAKGETEKTIHKTKSTMSPPMRRTTAPMVQVTTRPTQENQEVDKVVLKPDNKELNGKDDKEVIVPPEGGKVDKNEVAPVDPNHGKPAIVIAPTEKHPKWTKVPPTAKEPAFETTPSVNPQFYVAVKLTMSWREFCIRRAEFKNLVAILFEESSTAFQIGAWQVVVMYEDEHCGPRTRFIRRIEIVVDFYIKDRQGTYSKALTEMCFKAFKDGMEILRKSFDYKAYISQLVPLTLDVAMQAIMILEFNLSGSKESFSTALRSGTTMGTGIIVAIVIAAIAGFCLLVLLLLQLIYRRKSKGKTMRPYAGESYLGHTANNSLDSIAMAAIAASSNRHSTGFMNPGLELNTTINRQKAGPPSNAVVFPGLSSFNLDMEAIEAEFSQLPNNMPRLSEVPAGAEHKNRYANVIPIPSTRVHLRQKNGDKSSEYINANYVKGHKNRSHGYIATQAPVKSTVEDFWRMIWEQQTKVIVMVTGLDEKGISKCEEYFPRSDGVDNTLMFGDFMVVLKLQDVRQDYILSGLTLKDVERNLCREVVHFWYTGWPCQGVPETPVSIIHFLLHVQAYQSKSKAPEIIHCSPGTGRTGTLIATDICMKAFEDSGTADILNAVFRLRQDRAGAVQTKEQYAFIYKAINEYALMLSEPSLCPEENGLPSRNSRVGTSHDEIMKKY